MDLDDILPFLVLTLVLLGVVAAAGGVVHLVLRLRAGEGVTFPLRLLLRIYLYLITLISIIVLVTGASGLVEAGLGAALGKEFSYSPVYIKAPIRVPEPSEGARQELTQETEGEERERLERGLDRAMKEGILKGVSFTLVGVMILGLHSWGRRRLETEDDRRGMLHRGYLVLLLVIFGVITLVTLPSAIFDTLRFYILEQADEFGRSVRPGEPLAVAIVSLPVWSYYLNVMLRLVRRQDTEAPIPPPESQGGETS